MTDQGWGCIFTIGVLLLSSVIFYWAAYYLLDFFSLGEPHISSLSLLSGFSGALGMNAFLGFSDKG